jgi:hypothetical protein
MTQATKTNKTSDTRLVLTYLHGLKNFGSTMVPYTHSPAMFAKWEAKVEAHEINYNTFIRESDWANAKDQAKVRRMERRAYILKLELSYLHVNYVAAYNKDFTDRGVDSIRDMGKY